MDYRTNTDYSFGNDASMYMPSFGNYTVSGSGGCPTGGKCRICTGRCKF